MKKNILALNGGKPIINYSFKISNSIDRKDINSVVKVMKTGVLSGFVASDNEFFRGGNEVRKFENLWSKYFKVKFSVSVNSWTSGLIACIGALDFEPRR
jgi:Predicted pyridoxal phosphate-dependent enzyme apparently involved in regulation of cell wall biogenesis